MWNCPLSICLRIGVWCQHVWFESSDQNWFCQLTVKCNSVGSGKMSHCWTSAFNNHLDHCFTVFRDVEHRTKLRRLHVWGKYRHCIIQDAQNSPWSRFCVFQISCRVRVLKQSQSALLCSGSHMTLLPVFTRVLKIWNQTSQAFVTSSDPLGDCSCTFVCWTQNVWSSNACKRQAF